MSNSKEHWENVFATKKETDVSWFQEYPKTFIALLDLLHLPLNANIIDMGGGDSHFIDELIEKYYQNIFLLDISANATERTKKLSGDKAKHVTFIVSNHH